MPEEPVTTPDPNAAPPASPPAERGTTPSQPGQGEPERFDADYVKALRKEAADYRTKLRAAEETVRQHEQDKLSETERLQAKVAEYERKEADYERDRQERTLKYESIAHAAKLGIVDPDAAYRLLDPAEVEFDEQGNPTNLPKLLEKLVNERPYLAGPRRTGSADAGAAGGQAQPADMNALLRRAAGRA